MATPAFQVTWDYRCPFARNAHEHLVAGLQGGGDWQVTFRPFSLSQVHVPDGGVPAWEDPQKRNDLLSLEAGVVVRDRFADRFLLAHRELFAARHDHGGDLRDEKILRQALEQAGVPADAVFAEIEAGWPLETVRAEHEQAVAEHAVFGVPTFILDGHAVFVRLTNRPGDDAQLARRTIDRLLSLVRDEPELNEFKHTTIPR
jgi:2-hydroxychromene-2-carboxylate isomerase